MTEGEKRRLEAALVAYFSGGVPEKTAELWVAEISMKYDFRRAAEGIRRMARATKHPTLADLIEHIEALRPRRSVSNAPQLPAQAGESANSELRARVMRQVACDLVVGRLPQGTDIQAEFERRLIAQEGMDRLDDG